MQARSMFSILICICLAGSFNGCRTTPAENPELSEVHWKTYTHSGTGCTLDIPDSYTIQEDVDGRGVIFRYKGSPVVLLRYSNEEEGRKCGLWFGHEPVAQIQLAARDGSKYVYDHFDGPMYSRTVAYVIPYRDRYLALEYRTEKQELDAVQKHIHDSLRMD